MDLTRTYTDYFMMFSQLAEIIDNVVPLKPEYLSRQFCVLMKLWCTRPSMTVARLFQGDPISGFTMRTNISSDNVMSDRTFYFAASLKSISFKKNLYCSFNCVCMCVHACEFVCGWLHVSVEFRKGRQTPWSWSYRQRYSTHCVVGAGIQTWFLSKSSKNMLLATESSL